MAATVDEPKAAHRLRPLRGRRQCFPRRNGRFLTPKA